MCTTPSMPHTPCAYGATTSSRPPAPYSQTASVTKAALARSTLCPSLSWYACRVSCVWALPASTFPPPLTCTNPSHTPGVCTNPPLHSVEGPQVRTPPSQLGVYRNPLTPHAVALLACRWYIKKRRSKRDHHLAEERSKRHQQGEGLALSPLGGRTASGAGAGAGAGASVDRNLDEPLISKGACIVWK